MHSIGTCPPGFNGHQPEQRHRDDGSTQDLMPVSPGNFLLPNDQGQFTFSAEPDSMINYASMTGTGALDSGFTPNTASSFDTTLHPDVISHTFPPTNVQMQLQNYSLSAKNRNGYSVSPSHSVDHLSPEAAGYLSDSSYQNASTYTTPGFSSDFLSEFSSQLNFGENANAYPAYQEPVDMSALTGDSLATFNAQPQMLSHVRLDSHTQMMSPCQTNNSCPMMADERTRGASISGAQYMAKEYQPSSTPPGQVPQAHQYTPSKQQQNSPPLTNSPSNKSLKHPQSRTHLASPIVRVENYSDRGSPAASDTSRPRSKRSHGSRRTNNHLSPYRNDNSSDDDEDVQPQVRAKPVIRSMDRNEDGSWASGQAGLGPDDRRAMGDAWVPSLNETMDQRLKVEKKIEVQNWLTKSEVGSEAGDVKSSSNLLKPFAARRRAKSTNDAGRHGLGLGVHTDFDRIDDSSIPGPGIYINEGSEYDEYDDDDDDDDEELEPESPPAAIDFNENPVENEVSAFPLFDGDILGAVVRPWADAVSQPSTTSTRYQPPTSNAAMMRFRQRAKDVESASLAATVGSRRLSESDLGSIRAAPGVIKAIEPELKKQKDRQRRPTFFENILPKRTPTNYLKRKGSLVQQSTDAAVEKVKDPIIEKPKRMGSWGRPKSPRLDTNLNVQARELGPPSSTGLSAPNNKWYQGIRRSRSRSDIGKSPGLAELMTQHGGPPMPMLASPMVETEATKPTPQPSPAGDDDDDDAQEGVTMDLAVRSDPIIPTYEGFRTHAQHLNPRLPEYMVERITQEQMRRYKRLLEFRLKHLNAVKNRNCASKNFCTDLGGESQQLAPRAGNKDADAPFIGFQVTAPGSSEDDGEPLSEGTVVSAQFPSGVPLPPVKRLPAEFECPLCFKVKQFYKPSDWTKHVHEDVQPFTCTFPNCGEPKSFKRKADWVRHENERHRQLEHWTCQIADCNHTCYRKDNFVQHLVREHKIAEPKARTGKAAKEASANMDSNDIWTLVARCRRDTTKQPKDEPCRFCGNICTSWKKLTVHLAKHMEQISMPILPLVEQKHMNADTVISPVLEIADKGRLSATPNSRSSFDNPSRYNPNASTLAPGIDPSHTSFGQYKPEVPGVSVASNVMHTYPPPQLVPPPTQGNNAYGKYNTGNAENSQHAYSNGHGRTTYPGPDSSKVRSQYVNNVHIPHHQQQQNLYNLNGAAPSHFPMTPVSAVSAQMQQQQIFSDSPIDGLGGTSSYFAQEPASIGAGMGMGYDANANMQMRYQQQQRAAYGSVSYMPPQRQQQYHFQGQ